ncbi:bactofilin family protein [Tunicatimonas pelagia]|uniref:bactofilin family protein n=1 Tax=Tunicatimonas pelagia TaxID=931531 RepID=UPI0026656C80|nr:polymer-forming cytoskeletal protein [Tunicatimonas pelagia]WKN41068.1 polymer-forming cytoskeletal protein [Tunicatimonas pelagia]
MFNNNQDKKPRMEDSSSTSNIGKGTTIQGDIVTSGNISVEGEVKGNVNCQAKVALGSSSYVEGKVMAENAIIAGEIQGSIEVGELLTLKPTAVIHGDITTNKLIVEAGATFNGSCRMGVSVSDSDLSYTDEPETTTDDEYAEPESEEEAQSRTI